ncbi:MAG: phosphotransferase family protein [Actinobacteria bacterium]|nr:phosphotransferase family protein [Actinomycetota bacterium]
MAAQPGEYGPVRHGDELDFGRIADYVRSRIDGLGPLTAVYQFGNGAANLTYLLEFGGRPLVVRRPPFGTIAVGAHDMKREYRALSRLWRSYDRAPHAYLLCEDHAIAGSDFLVIEYRPGVVVWGSVPPGMAGQPDAGRRIGFAVVDALADLHRLDPQEAGVADLGRPDGFVDRQLSGWRARWAAITEPVLASLPGAEPGADLVAAVGARLTATKPPTVRTSVLHNDFKIDNCQFDPVSPDRVRSVFDWDMATIGDPLVDLGTMLNYWPDPSDDPDNPPSYPDGQQHMGLPTRAEVAARYATATGADLAALRWYEAFGCWKTAIVVAQLHHRYLQGNSHDLRQGLKGERILPLARRALAILTE